MSSSKSSFGFIEPILLLQTDAFTTAGGNGWAQIYKEFEYPPGSFDGCHTAAEYIRRARQLRMEREEREAARNPAPE